MLLSKGRIGSKYIIEDLNLPIKIQKRLEALGMLKGTETLILNSKSGGILIVKIRGTRLALGKNISVNIKVR